jgi:hypothetical protein
MKELATDFKRNISSKLEKEPQANKKYKEEFKVERIL